MSAHAVSLSGYLVLSDLGRSTRSRTCEVREKPHRDVPPYFDDLEPSFALKCIDLDDAMPVDSKQRAVQEMQELLNLQHPNIVRYHRAFIYEGRFSYPGQAFPTDLAAAEEWYRAAVHGGRKDASFHFNRLTHLKLERVAI